MGFFDKLFGGNKPANITLKSPIKGDMINVTEIPDPTFAESVLGPTTCFKPGDDGTVYAPCDGVVTQIFKTAHAVTLTSTDNVEILIHVGINTVDLKGEGFEALVKDDDQVKAGQPLIRFDNKVIAQHGLSNLVPVVVCNASDFKSVEFIAPKAVTTDDDICTIQPAEQ